MVDHNVDLREYLRRLLSLHWRVESAPDGAEALGRLRDDAFDLVLADEMMPNLDGIGLLRDIRGDERLKTTPVVLLTARAGEETAIEGLLAGADEYLVKPFSARELVARIGSQIELAKVRKRTQELNEVLVRISDAVRALFDPHALAQTACQIVAEHVRSEECHWTEVDWASGEYVVGEVYFTPGSRMVPIGGRQPMNDWEPFTSAFLAGQSVTINDVCHEPRLSDSARKGWAELRVGAELAVPIMAEGRLRTAFAVMQESPRMDSGGNLACREYRGAALGGSGTGACGSGSARKRGEVPHGVRVDRRRVQHPRGNPRRCWQCGRLPFS